MNETITRVLSGIVYLAVIIGLAFATPFWNVMAFLTLAMLAAREFGQLFWKASNGRVETLVYLVSSFVIGACAPILIPSITPSGGLLFPMAVLLIIVYVVLSNSSNIRSALAGTLMGTILIGIPFSLLPYLSLAGYELFLGGFILVWSSDTFAYVWGRLLGKRKLMPAISPGKTVEGFIGGILSTIAIGYLLSVYWPVMRSWQWVLCAILVAISSTLGDLLESALKRHRGVKDSGKLMPGHGGALDRFDGLLLAIPKYYLLVDLFTT